jgi:hypothetical protein
MLKKKIFFRRKVENNAVKMKKKRKCIKSKVKKKHLFHSCGDRTKRQIRTKQQYNQTNTQGG